MKTVALIPLRGGSKGIPDKNIKIMGGKPLCAWSLEAALQAKNIDEVFVSTDSQKIKDVVQRLGLGVTVLDRPIELAADDSSTESVMLHFMEKVPFDLLVTIQATSPLIVASQLDQALYHFNNGNYDSMLSAVRIKRFFWRDNATPINYDPLKRPRRQEFTGTLMENGAFYITKREILSKYQCRLGGAIGIYQMPEDTSIEIDGPEDWEVVARTIEAKYI